jgi:prolyl-tRNA editing enzyme YbaK/EbsC (Cys-tRNA(Pro) deacylase)
MDDSLSPSAQRVQNALTAAGFTNRVVEHAQTTRSAKEAATAIGCSVAQIAKSLIFKTRQTSQAILVIASGPNRVNEVRLQDLAGEAIEKADADFAQETTGFAIGGIPPLGHRSPIKTYIDEDLLKFAEIWAAAGNPNAVFRLTPHELMAMTGGEVVSIK